MKDSEVLLKCIEIAKKNKYPVEINISDDTGVWIVYQRTHTLLNGAFITDLFFDLDFAKALFGEQGEPLEPGKYIVVGSSRESWKVHLQQLAISTDRIAYLREWLEQSK